MLWKQGPEISEIGAGFRLFVPTCLKFSATTKDTHVKKSDDAGWLSQVTNAAGVVIQRNSYELTSVSSTSLLASQPKSLTHANNPATAKTRQASKEAKSAMRSLAKAQA